MTNDILTLIKIITALYFESLADDDAPYVFDEIRQVLSEIKVEGRGNLVLGSEEAAVESLRYTAEWLLNNQNEDIKYSRQNIIQRLRVNVHGDNEYIAIAEDTLDIEITSIDARKRVEEILQELRYEKRQKKLRQIFTKANRDLNFGADYIDTNSFLSEIRGQLDEMGKVSSGEAAGFVGRINFNNPEEIAEVLQSTADSTSPEGVLNTGLQGLNRATGVGGFIRGQLVNFGALTHHYKSGILIDEALYIPMFNDPHMWDETKKPLILRISFENTIEQDIGIMYTKLHQLQKKEKIALCDINTLQAAQELTDHFGQRGYEFQLETYDPNDFDVYALFGVIQKYIDAGYEIHAISCDYLTMIAHNTVGDRTDQRIQKTYEMTRNFCYPKGITFLTAHQLSTEAQNLSRENSGTFTKKVCSGGWYMDCRSLHTKLDLEFVMHIHKHIDGNKYLMFSMGKNRGSHSVLEKDKHFIYEFQEIGGIVHDVDGDDLSKASLPAIIDTAGMEAWGDD